MLEVRGPFLKDIPKSFATGALSGDDNPILTLDNIINYTDFTNPSKYTLSGNIVTGIARTLGTANFVPTGLYEEYDAAYFNGLGGIKSNNTAAEMYYDRGAATTAFTFGRVLYNPTNTVAYQGGLSGAASGSFNNDTRLGVNQGGAANLFLARNEANSFQNIGTIPSAPTIVFMIIRCNTAASMDAFVQSKTLFNFDPKDTWTTLNPQFMVAYGDQGSNLTKVGLGIAEHFDVPYAVPTEQLDLILDYWALKYGVTLT